MVTSSADGEGFRSRRRSGVSAVPVVGDMVGDNRPLLSSHRGRGRPGRTGVAGGRRPGSDHRGTAH